jgi:hypothetical protein
MGKAILAPSGPIRPAFCRACDFPFYVRYLTAPVFLDTQNDQPYGPPAFDALEGPF